MESTHVLVGNFIHGTYYIAHGDKIDMERALDALKNIIVDDIKVIEFDGDALDNLIDNSTEFTKIFNNLFENSDSTIKEEFTDDPFAFNADEKANVNFDFDDDEDDLLG